MASDVLPDFTPTQKEASRTTPLLGMSGAATPPLEEATSSVESSLRVSTSRIELAMRPPKIYLPPAAAHQDCSLCKSHHLTEKEQREQKIHGVDLNFVEMMTSRVLIVDPVIKRLTQCWFAECVNTSKFTCPFAV
jgi:hypothetical protein